MPKRGAAMPNAHIVTPGPVGPPPTDPTASVLEVSRRGHIRGARNNDLVQTNDASPDSQEISVNAVPNNVIASPWNASFKRRRLFVFTSREGFDQPVKLTPLGFDVAL